MDADNNLLPIWLLEQLLEEQVGVRQLLVGNCGGVSDEAISPIQRAVVLLTQALNEEDRCCKQTAVFKGLPNSSIVL